ncbi:MAG: 2-methylcitrate dehydratase [Syntrophorhabdus sp. PtaU1.Bin058]|nr:MAG: 2-methylcitrate dehydratase [Syntrophorhabdus sp. PtaU1.Bin058]
MSLSRQLAEEVLNFNSRDIPPHVIHQTERLILDTLGCAIGGYASDANRSLHKLIIELDGPKEATIVGSGVKTSCLNATLANGVMTRYLDYNDAVVIEAENGFRVGYHPSEVIPPILALAEKQGLSGLETIAAIILGYDLSNRFLEGIVGREMEQRGWNGDTRGAYIMPFVAGRILGLDTEQVVNAAGISGSTHAVLGILDASGEEYTMTKNLRFPAMAYGGIMAAMMARQGFTGPVNIFEGHDGFITTFLSGEYEPTRLADRDRRYTIMEACIKSIISDYSAQGHLSATLQLVKENDIKASDVAAVRITASTRCARHTGDPAKKYPHNKETADHSSHYLTAMAILERQLGPSQFSQEKYADPRVRELTDKVVFEGDPDLDHRFLTAGTSEIVTKQGQRYSCQVDFAKGHPKNPMSDEELVIKFTDMAAPYMSKERMDRIVQMIFSLHTLSNIQELNRLMIFEKQG